MKKTIITHVLTALIGFGLCYIIFVRSKAVEVVKSTEIVYIEKNKEEITEKPKTEVKTNHNDIIINTTLQTPYYGAIEIETILNRRLLQYNHQLSVGGVYLINTKSILASIGYSYKSFGLDLYGGYSFEIDEFEVGIGLKYIYKF